MKFTKTVRASKKVDTSAKRPVSASREFVRSDEEIDDIDETFDEEIPAEDDFVEEEEGYEEQSLLFDADDVAQVLAEATGESVDYTVDDETLEVSFAVGDQEITITPEGDEEVVEESTRVRGSKIAASRKVSASRKARK